MCGITGFFNLQTNKLKRFAEEPEFKKTEYLTPNHSDQDFSNFKTFGPLVRIGSF